MGHIHRLCFPLGIGYSSHPGSVINEMCDSSPFSFSHLTFSIYKWVGLNRMISKALDDIILFSLLYVNYQLLIVGHLMTLLFSDRMASPHAWPALPIFATWNYPHPRDIKPACRVGFKLMKITATWRDLGEWYRNPGSEMLGAPNWVPLFIKLVAGIWCRGFLPLLASGTSLPCASPFRLSVGVPILFQVPSFC